MTHLRASGAIDIAPSAAERSTSAPLAGGCCGMRRRRRAGLCSASRWSSSRRSSLFRLLPGDPVRALAQGRNMTPEQLDLERHRLGLDKSLPEQFLHFVGQTLHFDLGISYEYKRPVARPDRRTDRRHAAAHRYRAGDRGQPGHLAGRAGRVEAGQQVRQVLHRHLAGAVVGADVLARTAAADGVRGRHRSDPGDLPDPGDRERRRARRVRGTSSTSRKHMVLPCLTLVAVVYAQYLLVMRSSVLDEVGQDYVTTARAKGLRDDEVRRRHAVPNALLPTVTLVFMRIGFVVGRRRDGRGDLQLAGPRAAVLRGDPGARLHLDAGHVPAASPCR